MDALGYVFGKFEAVVALGVYRGRSIDGSAAVAAEYRSRGAAEPLRWRDRDGRIYVYVHRHLGYLVFVESLPIVMN